MDARLSRGCLIHMARSRLPCDVLHLFKRPYKLMFLFVLPDTDDGNKLSALTAELSSFMNSEESYDSIV